VAFVTLSRHHSRLKLWKRAPRFRVLKWAGSPPAQSTSRSVGSAASRVPAGSPVRAAAFVLKQDARRLAVALERVVNSETADELDLGEIVGQVNFLRDGASLYSTTSRPADAAPSQAQVRKDSATDTREKSSRSAMC
jgi:hypothetical protein